MLFFDVPFTVASELTVCHPVALSTQTDFVFSTHSQNILKT